MPRTAQKVDELADEGEHMTDALATVLDVAEEQGTVTWSDVSDEMTSGEWGRLIEKGVLVDADGDGFVIDDPEGIRDALDDADPTAMVDSVDFAFTTYDKMAVATVVVMMIGYAVKPVRTLVGQTLNVVLGPLESVLPFYLLVLVLAVLTGLFSALVQDNLMDPEIMAGYREQTQNLKERRERAKERGDDEEIQKIQEEQMAMMSENLDVFKAQFRPMIWIMSFTIPVFLWLYWFVRDLGVTVASPVIVYPLAGEVSTWTTGILGPIEAWIVWYALISMSFGQIMRKALNVQTSPSS
ncbi:DUF106 domain-containing protein [Halovenus salina]|uniref:DUF106 domain-containing protein n=1 Tax=Halovenus salina TaxID=1510225 RepID=A0ABD5W1F3_9EURY|nr:DUF106 domain-containing protein [Halovenus salina]